MTYKNFLQYEVASKFILPDDDRLVINFYKDDYFIVKARYLHQVMDIQRISYICKAISFIFGTDNHSYKSWSCILSYAKDYLFNLNHR